MDEALLDAGATPDAHPVDTAVCCSGGGIRSATYCLGALQALAADGRLRAVDLVTAVSGGSYIAAAWALQAQAAAQAGGHVSRASYRASYQEAFRPGSREEGRLRDHTHYLIPNAAQAVRGIMSLIWGAVGNLLLVASISYVVLGLDGWLLAAIGGVRWSRSGGQFAPVLAITPLQAWLPAGLGILAVLAFGASRSAPGRRGLSHADGTVGDLLMLWTTALLGLAVAATFLLVVGPALFTSALTVNWIATGMSGQPSIGSVAASLSLYAVGVVTLAKAAAGNVSAYWTRIGGGGQGILRPWLAKAGRALLPWLGSALVVIGLLAWGGYVLGVATRPGYSHWHLALGAVIFGVLHIAVDANRTSLHDFYRDRLASGYASQDYSAVRLSQLRHASPDLQVCGAANLSSGTVRSSRPAAAPRPGAASDHRQAGRTSALQRGVPPGRGAVSWVFSPETTGLRFPNERGGAELAQTRAYETLIGPDRMTLFDIVADSGAAISPLMGKATSAAYRVLLAAVNVRLGVWLPRPALVKLLQEHAEGAASLPAGAPGGRRAWAAALAARDLHGWQASWLLSSQLASWEKVYRYHDQRASGERPGPGAAVAAALRWRIWQPNLVLLWREAAGRNPVGRKWIYVTDGGHYDNLGLVEALRRNPRRIYVLDASGDPEHSYRALGQAIALARSDLGVQISIDPSQMELPGPGDAQPAHHGASADGAGDDASPSAAGGRGAGGRFLPGPRPAQVARPYVVGTFRYTSGPRSGYQGTIAMIKLGVWAGDDLPWDVRAYYEAHPTFPRSTTVQQLYDDEDFEAYRELGAASMRALLAASPRRDRRVPMPARPRGAPA